MDILAIIEYLKYIRNAASRCNHKIDSQLKRIFSKLAHIHTLVLSRSNREVIESITADLR